MHSSRIVLSTALALGLAAPAFAQTTYRLALFGDIDHDVNCWETVPQCSGPHDVHYAWTGTLTIVVDSAADGTYTGPDFESLSFAGNVGNFFVMPDTLYRVTIADGRVSSLDAEQIVDSPVDDTAIDQFSGLTAGYYGSGSHHYGGSFGVGTLTELPEPAPAALWLAGLAAGAAWRRRLRPAPAASAA